MTLLHLYRNKNSIEYFGDVINVYMSNRFNQYIFQVVLTTIPIKRSFATNLKVLDTKFALL